MAGRDSFRTTDSEYLDAFDLVQDGKPEEAIPILSRVVSLDPTDHEAFELLVTAHIEAERFDRVVQLADEGVAAGRPAASLLVWKSLALAQLDRPDEAERVAREALQVDPALDTAAFTLSNMLIRRDRTPDALEVCTQFLAHNPESELIAGHAVMLASDLDRFDLTIELARDYRRRHGDDAGVLHRLGLAYIDRNDFRKGERAFRDAIALEPDDVEYNACLVLVLILQKEERKADRYMGRLAARDPEFAVAVDEFVDEFFADTEEDE